MAILLEKLVGIEIFPCSFSSANEEKMISHQGRRV
jgi:hypothetical protein